MKSRNGFISNSSSASFLLAFPKESNVDLIDIEEYFGGFNEDLSLELRTVFAYEIWTSQYLTRDGCRRTSEELGKEYKHYTCNAPQEYKEKHRDLKCPHYFKDETEGVTKNCTSCRYLKAEKRTIRGDDYYTSLDNCYDKESAKWLEEHVEDRVFCLEIDDNNPPGEMPQEIAGEITNNAYRFFKTNAKAFTLW